MSDLPTKHDCLLTNTPSDAEVEYCHVLIQETPPQVLDDLERAWNLQHHSLHVDTRYNIVKLTPTLHSAFTHGRWVLMPEHDGVWPLFEARNSPEILERLISVKKISNYHLVACAKMEYIPVIYNNRAPGGEVPSLKTYTYPFSNFPTIQSRVPVHLIICQIGYQMAQNNTYKSFIHPTNKMDLIHFRTLGIIRECYDVWTGKTKGVQLPISPSTALSDSAGSRTKGTEAPEEALPHLHPSPLVVENADIWDSRKSVNQRKCKMDLSVNGFPRFVKPSQTYLQYNCCFRSIPIYQL
ncbi:hypothetical protein D9756_009512 [Leucocoprinus leucothites]|uniref:HNH nuclease domain-containing protein n=1 Tax=Leucocoprinus leucothites TaxID=201217 RepID=A0A8H5CYV2_9AGAR|nr:hypothetical protein D9756_009512 [Leucoagaricus leucothites]